jgi:phosphoribosylamine--glycine ligase
MEKILVIGKGAREHALSYALFLKGYEVFVLPGNPGMKEGMEVLANKNMDFETIRNFVKEKGIEWVVVGPEEPLVKGIKDYLSDIAFVFGPSKKEAVLEGEKYFSKEFMAEYGIPTADFEVFTEPVRAYEYIDKKGAPLVVKASGLAAGKGSIVCRTKEEAKKAVEDIMERKVFGEAGNFCVIEDFLEGIEVSIIGVFAGDEYILFPPSQDHKPVYDGDKGPNTGGMGAYSPLPFLSPSDIEDIEKNIVKKTLKGFVSRGFEYQGFLYFGLMLTKNGPYVLEYNVRMGDPEGQVLLYLMDSDLFEIIKNTKDFTLLKSRVVFKSGYANYVVLASKGYPGSYEKGKVIKGWERVEKEKDMKVFFAGVKEISGELYTNGGRVMGVLGYGETLEKAIERSYEGVSMVYFEGMHYRRDIGRKGLKLG